RVERQGEKEDEAHRPSLTADGLAALPRMPGGADLLDLAGGESGDSPRVFFIYRQNETMGPYTAEEVRRRIAQGTIATEDYCWREGMADWQVIAETEVFAEGRTVRRPRRVMRAPVTMQPAQPPPQAVPEPAPVYPEAEPKPPGNLWPN